MKATEKLENLRKHMGDEFMEEAFGEGSPASAGSPIPSMKECPCCGGKLRWMEKREMFRCMRGCRVLILPENDKEMPSP